MSLGTHSFVDPCSSLASISTCWLSWDSVVLPWRPIHGTWSCSFFASLDFTMTLEPLNLIDLNSIVWPMFPIVWIVDHAGSIDWRCPMVSYRNTLAHCIPGLLASKWPSDSTTTLHHSLHHPNHLHHQSTQHPNMASMNSEIREIPKYDKTPSTHWRIPPVFCWCSRRDLPQKPITFLQLQHEVANVERQR